MDRRRIVQFVAGLCLLASSALLAFPTALVWPIVEAPYVPLGNVTTWMGLISLSLLCFVSAGSLRELERAWQRVLRGGMWVAVVMAVAWYPLSYALAGNFASSFRGQPEFRGSARAGVWYWRYTATMVVAPLLLWTTQALAGWIGRLSRGSSPQAPPPAP